MHDLQTVLKKFDVLQAVAVVALIHRVPGAEIAGRDDLKAVIDAVVERSTELEVLRSVVHQFAFRIPVPYEFAQTGIAAPTGESAVVVVQAHILVAIDVHRIISPRVVNAGRAVLRRAVVLGLPIVSAKPIRVQLIGPARPAILVLEHLGPTHGGLQHVALTALHAHAQSGEVPRAFGGHVDHSVEGARPVVCRAGARDHVHLQYVQVAGPEEISEGEVEARALVVHPVDQLQRAYRTGAVEAARVDHFEAEARRGHVHTLQVA